jgi:hypothetical protein
MEEAASAEISIDRQRHLDRLISAGTGLIINLLHYRSQNIVAKGFVDADGRSCAVLAEMG